MISILSKESNQIFIYSIISIIIFFQLVMPLIKNCYIEEKRQLKERMENIF